MRPAATSPTPRAARGPSFRGARFALTAAGRAALAAASGTTSTAASCHAPALPTPAPAWLAALAQLQPGDRLTVVVHAHGTAAVVSRVGFLPIGAPRPPRGTP